MERLVLPLLWSSALVFALIGIYFLVLPERAAASIGVVLSDATARTDVRATYGGMMLGTALFFVWAALASDRHTAGLWLMLLMYGGLALGRGVAIVGGERPGVMMWSFLVIEFAVAVFSGLALHKG